MYLPLAGQLEHVAMPDQVRPNVSIGVLDTIAHARLGPQVDDVVESVGVSEPLQRLGIREVDAREPEAIAVLALKATEARLLQRGIVIVVEIVDADDLVATFEKCARSGSSDETRSSRDQNSHQAPIGGAVGSAKALERRRESFMDLRDRSGRDVHG